MQILSLDPPINCGTLYSGTAENSRGQRYMFCATLAGKALSVFREHTEHMWNGRTYWHQLRGRAPRALSKAVLAAVRKSRH